ncbi:MAG: hypothetical protein A2X86_05075 [Bdellovibrionales bacterium GWA2_49_15]|nr:MAG: hypothetical protein A2X86_05075 [Bdellovibrionales bacterium GWA2_49_15]
MTKKILSYLNSILLLFLLVACNLNPRIEHELILAQELIKSQKYSDAIFLLEKILKGTVPTALKGKVYYQLGELYSLHFRDYQTSLKYYEKLRQISEDPKWQIKAEEKKAEINFLFFRNYNESITIYKKLVSFTPRLENYSAFLLRLGQSYLYNKNFEQAEAIFKRIGEDQDSRTAGKSLYYLGLMSFIKKEYLVAIDFWKEYLKVETNKESIVQTKFLIANAYETIEELKKAYNLYYSLMGEYPNTEVLKQRLTSIYNRRIARKR